MADRETHLQRWFDNICTDVYMHFKSDNQDNLLIGLPMDITREESTIACNAIMAEYPDLSAILTPRSGGIRVSRLADNIPQVLGNMPAVANDPWNAPIKPVPYIFHTTKEFVDPMKGQSKNNDCIQQ